MNFKKRHLLLPAILFLSFFSLRGVGADFALVRDSEIAINIFRALSENYVDTLSTRQLLHDATQGIAQSLDPYTSYIDETQMDDFQLMTTGKYGGIGAVIRQDSNFVSIAQPYKGTPADKAGLLIGDKILKIDGKNVVGKTTQDVSEMLKGVPGSKVKVTVLSMLDSTERKVTLRRERIEIPAIPFYGMLSDSTGYIKHSEFTTGGADLMRKAVSELKNRGMKSLILDYRDNGGGVMQEAIDVLSIFLPAGSEVLTMKSRETNKIYKTKSEPLLRTMPLAVLIDGNSASASEIVAGALQDLSRAVIIGERSFGKGLVQSTIPVGYNSYIKLTTARYHIPSGRCIQALDYSDHNTGRVVHRVADSLRKEFKTARGRKVYDGGGVSPDIEMKSSKNTRFAATLYAEGLINEWGEEYFRRHFADTIDVAHFELSEEDYRSFVSMAKGRTIKYKSNVEIAVEELKKAAEEDENPEFLKSLQAMQGDLKDSMEDRLWRYRESVEEQLRLNIVLRFAYLQGVIENSLKRDSEVLRAQALLANPQEMEKLLSPAAEPLQSQN